VRMGPKGPKGLKRRVGAVVGNAVRTVVGEVGPKWVQNYLFGFGPDGLGGDKGVIIPLSERENYEPFIPGHRVDFGRGASESVAGDYGPSVSEGVRRCVRGVGGVEVADTVGHGRLTRGGTVWSGETMNKGLGKLPESWEKIDAASAALLRSNAEQSSVDHAAVIDESVSEEDQLIDELAEVLSEAGADRKSAMRFANAVISHEKKKDRRAVGEVLASGAACAPAIMGRQANDSVAMSDAEDAIMEMLFRAYDHRDSKFSLGCLCFAYGRPPLGVPSMRSLAELRGVSVEAVSKETETYQRILGLPRTEQQKSPAAVASYQRVNGAQTKGGS
jgi:hypothetical protein